MTSPFAPQPLMPGAHALPPVGSLENVTPDALRQLISARRPVVLKGVVRHWPVVQVALRSAADLADYLKAKDRGQSVFVLEAPPEAGGRFFYSPDMKGLNFTRTPMSLPQALDRILAVKDCPDPPCVYIQSLPIPPHLTGFADENRLDLIPAFVEPRLWLGNAARTQTHNDENHNIACAVAGRRRFTLFPPEQVSNLYMGPVDFTPAGTPISLADLESPDFSRFPRLRDALNAAMVADLEPGDGLFIPMYWWHHVQSSGPFNMLVNYWWGGAPATLQHPMAAFMTGLLALKDLPPHERRYWREMFDHFVFQSDGDPVGHIPEGAQGPLGPPSRDSYGKLIRRLKRHAQDTPS